MGIHTIRVESFPDGFEGRDYYVICGCGWVSLPLAEMPSDRQLVCEACEAMAHGLHARRAWYDKSAAQFTATVELVLPHMVCSWCQAEMREGVEPTSHGICLSCKERALIGG